MQIRPLTPADADNCDAIILSLPYHFKSAEGRADCTVAVRSQEGLVALVDDEVVAFLTFARHYTDTAEITGMAVRGDRRRSGIGRALIEELVNLARSEDRTLLLVTTLSANDPDDTPEPPDGYQSTRAFYEKAGFSLARDMKDYWGPGTELAVLMVKPL